MFEDYYAWLDVADTSIPRNIFGYIFQNCLSVLRNKPYDISIYNDPKVIAKCGRDIGKRSFLQGKLPKRDGPRPAMLRYIAPNRQASQFSDKNARKLLSDAIKELVKEHSAHVTIKSSVQEKSGDALLIHDNIVTPHAVAKANKREIVHVHTGVGSGDHSLHLCLSPTDCKEVITKQWAERMPLAGTLVPHEYLLVYTPRTEAEVAVVKDIINAAITFMTGDRDFIDY